MSLGPGSTLGPFKIQSLIGKGGMGEVFSAHDTRLNRDVAVKVLPGDFASDPDRLRRFEGEARTLAALNHPNILTIFDTGIHESSPYLISELLDGWTLREELSRGPLPLRRAADYALQAANGLAAAHGHGIIHRDLKPENIFLTRDGRLKILDFGLAKPGHTLNERRGPASDPAGPTVIQSTVSGAFLGTPGYMSPEQVRGESADQRSDIFALGCVVYEMLTAAPAFKRDTAVECMNAVLKADPIDLTTLNSSVSPALERLVRRCLEKEPDKRWQTARDLAFALEVASNAPPQNGEPQLSSHRRVGRVPLLIACGLVALAFSAGYFSRSVRPSTRSQSVPSIRYLTYSGRDYSPAASADGTRICFVSDRDGTNRIWVKDLASAAETPLTFGGSDDSPRFSRDGSMILFTRATGTDRALFRMPSLGGDPLRMVNDALWGDWSPDGRQIVFLRWDEDESSSLYIAGVDGSGETLLHRFVGPRCSAPRWSPDGKKIAVVTNDGGRPQTISIIDIASKRVTTWSAQRRYNLVSAAAWDNSSEYVYYMQAESASANSSGSPAMIFKLSIRSDANEKLYWTASQSRVLDLLPSGNLLMDARSSRENLKEIPLSNVAASNQVFTLGNSTDRQPSYSPDGELVVFSSNRSGNLELWTISRKTGVVRPLTNDPADDWDPGFSPDGKQLVWSKNRTGNFEIWIANADGSSPKQVSQDGFSAENPTMTPDGRWIVYASTHPEKAGIWKIHPDGTGATPLIRSSTSGNAEISPNGKYVAYIESKRSAVTLIRVVELESGTHIPFEIRVEPVKQTAAIIGRLRWMPDGKSIVFMGQDAHGVNGLFIQDFLPSRADTSNTRRQLTHFDSDNSAESFGISPDGRFITIAVWEQFFSLWKTEGFE